MVSVLADVQSLSGDVLLMIDVQRDYPPGVSLPVTEAKAIWPGRKQAFRRFDSIGQMAGDTLTLESDSPPGMPLLSTLLRRLDPASLCLPYVVDVAEALRELARQVDRQQGTS